MPTFDRVVLGGTRCNLLCHIVTLYRYNVRVKSFGFIFVAGGRLGVGMRRRGVLAAAAGSVRAAAGRAAVVAVFGERLPFSAAEFAARVGGGDGWCGAADVFCGAAEVRCRIRFALRRRAARPPVAPLTATAPPVGCGFFLPWVVDIHRSVGHIPFKGPTSVKRAHWALPAKAG